jgi:hypothetical protein
MKKMQKNSLKLLPRLKNAAYNTQLAESFTANPNNSVITMNFSAPY